VAIHKVFVSYHHANDQQYRDSFEKIFAVTHGVFMSKSVQIGDLSPWLDTDAVRAKIRDDYLRDSTVTVVLVGSQTWQRRHVDWEIASSIRQTALSSRSGLVGILLPTHPSFYTPGYDAGIVPPRLVDNQKCGYAKIYNWSVEPIAVSRWIQEAFDRRSFVEPDNSYPHFVNNKFGDRWS
jgi:hypothetical protein